jgi:hypothetical protein
MAGIERWVMGVLVALIALVGLFMASRAHDNVFMATGLVFFLFGVLFIFGLIGHGGQGSDSES